MDYRFFPASMYTFHLGSCMHGNGAVVLRVRPARLLPEHHELLLIICSRFCSWFSSSKGRRFCFLLRTIISCVYFATIAWRIGFILVRLFGEFSFPSFLFLTWELVHARCHPKYLPHHYLALYCVSLTVNVPVTQVRGGVNNYPHH